VDLRVDLSFGVGTSSPFRDDARFVPSRPCTVVPGRQFAHQGVHVGGTAPGASAWAPALLRTPGPPLPTSEGDYEVLQPVLKG